MIGYMPRAWVAELLRITAKIIGVNSLTCSGALGEYEAHIGDRGVMGYYLMYHIWEPHIQSTLGNLCSSGEGTFIDIGANIGLTSIPLKQAYPKLRIIGIEADQDNFKYLRCNVFRANMDDIVLYNCAVYSCDGEINFERSMSNAGDHRVRQGMSGNITDRYGESKREVVKVPCSRLDTLLDAPSLVSPVGMKCDIQGAEVHFLRGAHNTLNVIDWLVIEFWPYGIARAETSVDEFFNLLEPQFPLVGIIKPGVGAMPKFVPVSYLREQIAGDLRREGETAHCELLFVKQTNI